jgi:hypothetical protein
MCVQPWSDFVEIYWARGAQAYVTPVGTQAVCVALISKQKIVSFADELASFPRVAGATRWRSSHMRCAWLADDLAPASLRLPRKRRAGRGSFGLLNLGWQPFTA